MIKTLIFDLGGVILDLNRANAVKGFEAIGISNAEDLLDLYHQQGLLQELEEGVIDAEEFRRRLSITAGRELTREAVSAAWLSFFEHDPQDKLDYMDAMRSKYRVLVLSNTNEYVMEWVRSNNFTAAGRPLDDYADGIYLSYQIKVLKPNPKIFEYLIRDSGITPSEALFLDDGAANIAAARKMGFHTMQPQNGEDWREAVTSYLKNQ
jgi:putative hydrolase of the HAD superfamily